MINRSVRLIDYSENPIPPLISTILFSLKNIHRLYHASNYVIVFDGNGIEKKLLKKKIMKIEES